MRGGLLLALLLITTPLAQRAQAADLIGDLLMAATAAPVDVPPDASLDAPPVEGRRRPGQPAELPPAEPQQQNKGAVSAPPPDAFPADQVPIPDRWRLIEAVGVHARWFDPYNQNTLKGDRPIAGTQDWFFTLIGLSDTVIEPRSFPLPVGSQTTTRPGSNDNFGRARSFEGSQTILVGLALTKGSTAFKPPEIEARLTLAFNDNYAQVSEKRILSVSPSNPPRRNDAFVGVQEAFIDYHIRNVSERYDFDSVRVGIQAFSSDFRGFLFQDNQLGVRLFGDRDNNRWQYNLAAFQRIEKDTNSGLNDLGQPLRKDYVFVANLYRQDLPVPGITSQLSVVYNRNREAGEIHFDDNGFPVRPALIGNDRTRDYDIVYLGYNADGHIGRLNLTASAYSATGEDRNSIFTSKPAHVQAWFAAFEPSYDLDWIRIRGSALYASGDSKPYDNRETGFDAIVENPQFAGADTSYWIRQSIPFIGGGQAISLNGRNGVLADLRSSKDEGQSNFNNPGTVLLGAGADFDLTPRLRLSANINRLWFDNTAVLQVLRNEGSISRDLGWDYSVSAIWRPKMTQNLVFRGSVAIFDPGSGFTDLFSNSSGDRRYYSVLLDAILNF
ncbi:MAG TPA: hypothetical protein VNW53_16830 [Phenylobacterium sp.]|jgi:hypothetical protein|uniref:hypothetical protein n=1 Tax=Phenylobacterium sp. TaxID=1871053 RepID=UPI002D1BC386|nr:hypothetical protein [Phenylobacterium sp.]HXA40667.1 hypothetical protein [Phenylobacterium sp.]